MRFSPDRDLSNGERYSSFGQPEPGCSSYILGQCISMSLSKKGLVVIFDTITRVRLNIVIGQFMLQLR